MPDPSSPIPHPKPSDHEDVSWALSTAEATWRRGDHADALKWLQRAAEAASEAGLDTRYLELAKASSELAGHIDALPRTPQATTEDPHPSGATLVQPMAVVLPEPARKSTSGPPPLPAASGGSGARSVPPARPSSPSPPRAASKPSPSRVPAPLPSRPAVGASKGKSDSPAANKGGANKSAPPPAESGALVRTGARRVSENLRTVRDLDKMTHLAALTRSEEGGGPQTVQGQAQAPDESDDQTQLTGPSSAAPLTEVHPTLDHDSEPEIEPWPTQTSRRAAQAAKIEAERTAAAAAAPNHHDATLVPDPNAPQSVATQALRVVLYRTPDGVRIAPAGAKIPAISVDAMLVALDPSVDLAAWLK